MLQRQTPVSQHKIQVPRLSKNNRIPNWILYHQLGFPALTMRLVYIPPSFEARYSLTPLAPRFISWITPKLPPYRIQCQYFYIQYPLNQAPAPLVQHYAHIILAHITHRITSRRTPSPPAHNILPIEEEKTTQ